jgi:hypothetical protein
LADFEHPPINPYRDFAMTDGYLSKNRDYLNKAQRERRRHYTRIDYMPPSAGCTIP